jgi:hypothetical protein
MIWIRQLNLNSNWNKWKGSLCHYLVLCCRHHWNWNLQIKMADRHSYQQTNNINEKQIRSCCFQAKRRHWMTKFARSVRKLQLFDNWWPEAIIRLTVSHPLARVTNTRILSLTTHNLYTINDVSLKDLTEIKCVYILTFWRRQRQSNHLRYFATNSKVTASILDEQLNFSIDLTFQHDYGHGVDSTSNRNVPGIFLGVAGGQHLRLTTSLTSASWLPRKCRRLLHDFPRRFTEISPWL